MKAPAVGKTYLVGGAVRDRQLGYAYSECDWVVVGASSDELLAEGFKPVGKDFPVFLHPDTGEEYALARTERKTAPGYSGFAFHADPGVTLEEDLLRRDLTINAMAETADGKIIDPYGGLDDLKTRTLRHVSAAFSEDPVRVLRVARFAARYHHLGFRVADETLEMMRSMVANDEVQHLVAERVWRELQSALTEQSPHRFIEVLRDCGALRVILPEVDSLFGVPQPAGHHPEIDCGIHCLLCVQAARKLCCDDEVIFATLVHDLGKAATPQQELPRHIGHEQRSLPLINALCDRLSVPNRHRELALLVAAEHTLCHRVFELRAGTLLALLERADAFRRPQRLDKFLLACEADARGRKGLSERPYPQANYLREAFDCCCALKAQDFKQRGFSGKQLGKELRTGRLHELERFRKHHSSQN